MTRWIPAAAIATFVLGAQAAYAQAPAKDPRSNRSAFPAGIIEGRVLDDSQSPVAGAMVSVVGRTTAAATTDRDGRYTLRELPYGPYILSVHSRGYFKSRGRTVQLTTSKVSIPEIQLQLASARKAPVVGGGAGGRRDRRPGDAARGFWHRTHPRNRAPRRRRRRASPRRKAPSKGKRRGGCGTCRAAS